MHLCPIAQDGSVDLRGAQLHPVLGDTLQATVGLYQRKGFCPPWIGYVALEHGNVVGSCGFAAPPKNSEAEIAYFTFPGNEGRGVATMMATALILVSQNQARTDGVRFIAHTLPEEGPSTAILRKLDFELIGSIDHEEDGEVWKWRRREGDV
ncbi:MAG: N-acetyltransferase [Nevskiaceae bacterium]|nr:MAG: N-acetyltransferase [Nevskiaceae bacterium]TAM33166.1 MAG: N-acetyltransferase [Nevskiaceae bacterium]